MNIIDTLLAIIGLRYYGPNDLWRKHPKGTEEFPFAPGLRYLEFGFGEQRRQ